MDARRTSPSRSVGYALVLIGSIGFLISCFLPYSSVISEFGPRSESLFRLTAIRDSIIATAGAYLHLFAGVSIVGVTAALGLKWRRGWARTGVIAAGVVWSVSWLGILIEQPGFFSDLKFGYWFLFACILLVLAGTIVVAASAPRRGPVEGGSESEPVPALRP
jgi:hypothetical protein